MVHTQNREDAEQVWAKNAECSLVSVATEYKGFDAIYHDFLINRIRANNSRIDLINDGLEIRLVNPELAILVFQYHTEAILRATGLPGGIRGIETQVAVKEDGQWKLVHVHYSKAVD